MHKNSKVHQRSEMEHRKKAVSYINLAFTVFLVAFDFPSELICEMLNCVSVRMKPIDLQQRNSNLVSPLIRKIYFYGNDSGTDKSCNSQDCTQLTILAHWFPLMLPW